MLPKANDVGKQEPFLRIYWIHAGGHVGSVSVTLSSSFNSGFILFQILTLYDAVDSLNIDTLVSWVAGLQQEDGSFYGDKWGEFCSCKPLRFKTTPF